MSGRAKLGSERGFRSRLVADGRVNWNRHQGLGRAHPWSVSERGRGGQHSRPALPAAPPGCVLVRSSACCWELRGPRSGRLWGAGSPRRREANCFLRAPRSRVCSFRGLQQDCAEAHFLHVAPFIENTHHIYTQNQAQRRGERAAEDQSHWKFRLRIDKEL